MLKVNMKSSKNNYLLLNLFRHKCLLAFIGTILYLTTTFCWAFDNKEFCIKNPNNIKCMNHLQPVSEELSLDEILNQKIYKNTHITKVENSPSHISLFMNPHNKVPKDTATWKQNTAMQEQISRLNKLQRLEYEELNQTNYIYGFGLSIPINNNKN